MKHRTLFFSISMMLLVLTALDIYAVTHPRELHYGPCLAAERLSTKPEMYIVVTEPDPYLLEALSNPGTVVFVGSWDNTMIDKLLKSYHYQIFDVEYNGAYYTVQMYSGDVFFYHTFFWILLFSWIVLGAGFIISLVTARRG